MKIGVKFCGGCNPRYNRRNALTEIQDKLPQIDFQYAKVGEVYDELIVIGGCTNNCASYDEYEVISDINKICDEAQIGNLIVKLNKAIK